MSYHTFEGRGLFGDSFRRMSGCGLQMPQKCHRWSFLLLSTVNAVIVVGLSIAHLICSSNSKILTFKYDAVILFIGVAAFWLAYHGIVFEYQYEIYLHFLSMIVAISYCWVDFYCNTNSVQTIMLFRCVMPSCLIIPSFLFCVCVTCSELWSEFYIIGTSEEFLNMHKKRRFLLCFLKFDFVLVVTIGIFSINEHEEFNFKSYVSFIFISIYALVFWIILSCGIRHEKPILVYIFVYASVALPIWVTYKFTKYNCLSMKCTKYEEALNFSEFISGIISIIIRLHVLVKLLDVYKNFGCGLSDRAFRYLISPESSSLIRRPRSGSL